MLRAEVIRIILGSIFLFVGIVAVSIAAMRRRERITILCWFGAFSGLYGLRLLAESPLAWSALPSAAWAARPYVISIVTYTILIPALLFWLELGVGKLRTWIKITVAATVVVGIFGISDIVLTGSARRFLPFNNALAIAITVVIAVINLSRPLARRYLAIQSPVLAVGGTVLAAAVLQANLATFFSYQRAEDLEPIAFGIFVLSIGYIAVERVVTGERRLFALDQELAIAREIQTSILPARTPELAGARIAALYRPMTSVAGDFYEFIQLDEQRAGFFIADVSGHGVPAALIASMIKVAMHSVQATASDPAALLRGLNRILSHQLKNQLVTAAYLYVDMQTRSARYAGAGHPPLLHWNAGEKRLNPIEQNGLLFGVLKDADYSFCELSVRPGDHFLLYTDGLVEPENASGEAFGDRRLPELMSQHHAQPASSMANTLFEEMKRWQPGNTPQSDDITLLVFEAL